MDEPASNRWQFSLRALLVVVTLCAVMAAAWRVVGGSEFLQTVVFVAASAVLAILFRGPWRRAYLLAYGAVYGPFVVMAVYMTLYAECLHCKAAAWTMFPYGPGFVTGELARSLWGIHLPWGVLRIALAVSVSVGMVAALTWFVKCLGRWWRIAILVVVAAFCSFCAFGLMALIRA
jgi:hypothetical protein